MNVKYSEYKYYQKLFYAIYKSYFLTLYRKPNKLSIVWTRRSRRVSSEPLDWEPSLSDPLKGVISWAVPDNHTVSVTLFKDPRTHELEDKDWTFVIEDVRKNKYKHLYYKYYYNNIRSKEI